MGFVLDEDSVVIADLEELTSELSKDFEDLFLAGS